MQLQLDDEKLLRMKVHLKTVALLACTLWVVLHACRDESVVRPIIGVPPNSTCCEIPVSTPQLEGLDTTILRVLDDSIRAGVYGPMRSLLIVKNHRLVTENYYFGWTRDRRHPMFSVTKSMSAAVIGIALERGDLPDVHASMYELLPSLDHLEDWTEEKKTITLEHMLTMTSGFQWDELGTDYLNPENSHRQMMLSDDWTRYVIEQPMAFEPGERFRYNTGTSNLFSLIIRDNAGEDFDAYAHGHLFEPLDFTDISWYYMTGDFAATGGTLGGVFLTALDMTKYGMLYINKGRWYHRQVLTEEWVEASIASRVRINATHGYGYQWFVNEAVNDASSGQLIEVPYAAGFGGQYIFLIRPYDMVVTVTSDPSVLGNTSLMIRMLEDYILAAIVM